MLEKWYDARPEVREWQSMTKAYARKFGVTRTLMGRYRNLPEALSGNRKLLGHAERASINTPIQGGAADIAMMAMIKINKNEKLQRLGWILLMQIHDEVILEGPEETAEEAFDEVIKWRHLGFRGWSKPQYLCWWMVRGLTKHGMMRSSTSSGS
jgi:DNA polymerase I